MFRLTEILARALEKVGSRRRSKLPPHLLVANRGEMEAYLHLRRAGYRIVATNFRVPQSRGEIDIIAWDGDVLCFIEVKTRVGEGLTPPEAAVDVGKRRHILDVARHYLRRVPGDRPPPCRFDVVSVVLGSNAQPPEIALHKHAFNWDTDRQQRTWNYRDRSLRRRWQKR